MFQFSPAGDPKEGVFKVLVEDVEVGFVRPVQKGEATLWSPVSDRKRQWRSCGAELYPSQLNAAMALFIASDEEDLDDFVNKITERIEDAQRRLASLLSEEVPKYLADDLNLVLATLDNAWEALGDCHEAVGIAKEDIEEAKEAGQEVAEELAEALGTLVDFGKADETPDTETLEEYQILADKILKPEDSEDSED